MTAGMTFLRRSGFPFLTVAITMSPTQAEGSLLRRPLIPFTEMMYRFFAPVLSAQFTVAATGRPNDILNLLPADPPRPVVHHMNHANEYETMIKNIGIERQKDELGFGVSPRFDISRFFL